MRQNVASGQTKIYENHVIAAEEGARLLFLVTLAFLLFRWSCVMELMDGRGANFVDIPISFALW
jgi:hypothetical protein